jgi:signal transduction histidine kinase
MVWTSWVDVSARHGIGATVSHSIEGDHAARRHPEGRGASFESRDVSRRRDDGWRGDGLYGGSVNKLRWLSRDRTIGTRRAPSVFDWLLTLALLAVALAEVATGTYPGPMALATIVQVASVLPVAVRRLAPVVAIAIGALVMLPYTLLFGAANSLAGAATLLVLVYAVGRYADPRGLIAGTAMGLLVIVELGIGGRLATPEDWVYVLIIYGVALGLGVALRVQVRRSTALAVVADRAQREQESRAQAAVHDERARIARELHDVVAHNVGLIVLQAGGARSVLATDPDRARAALHQVEETGRQTLAEMRHLVGILRVDDGADRQPLAGLARLPALMDEARAGGLTVELDVDGAVVDLPAGLELTAFRLIQEALTNVRKHAPASRARVHLGYEPDQLRIEVRDDGGPSKVGRGSAKPPGSGHGLIGMRERVRLYDGRMQAGPLPGGGFRVEATLPLTLGIA